MNVYYIYALFHDLIRPPMWKLLQPLGTESAQQQSAKDGRDDNNA